MTQILMPKATAVWLIDNTSLTFNVANGIRGADPIANGQLDRSEIEKGEADSNYALKANTFESSPIPDKKKRKGPRYTPLSRRQDRPDAIAWIVRNHPEITDAQISKLIGTTKPTIKAIRERTHWKISLINPTDPVSLGLCSQIDLDATVRIAAEKKAKRDKAAGITDEGESLKPVQGAPDADVVEEAKTHTLESLFKPQSDT